MSRRTAFTLIEVVTAVSITVFLALIAIPRYTELVDRQEFLGSALQVVRCVQIAQTEAAAPVTSSGKQARWIVAEIRTAQGAIPLTCGVGALADTTDALQAHLPSITGLSALTPDDADGNTADARYTIGDVTIPISQLAETMPLRFYFGVKEKGRLVATRYQVGGSYTEQTLPIGGWVLSSTRRAGVTASFTVPDSGTPISVQ